VKTRDADENFMEVAIREAHRASAEGEVPVGAVMVYEGKIVARGHNRLITLHDPTAHAEIMALRQAGRKMGNYRFPGTTLYVTLEPCIMCAGALVWARVERLVYGASDPKAGGCKSQYEIVTDKRLNHRLEVRGGVCAQVCEDILSGFFRGKRL